MDHRDADEETLARLNRDYPGYRTWRSLDRRGRPSGWVATSRAPDNGDAPTLHGSTAPELEEQLRRPPPGYGRSLARLKTGEQGVAGAGGEGRSGPHPE
ncbi:hypothetical protein [Actinorugispora endophytica]|uniref:Uncharacterized protein n=1 Tax=Actinorugispora endophytica TaxID=1605990 RepID=A0A4R6V570_9ACTN|nr:hypothetical protein [Actinorugispora endophytica]TDQ55491.1 hypothetical protein EV190_101821 [Actinorugispora endophytica]